MDEIRGVLADFPGLGQVQFCDCNAIHLCVGPVTLNLAPEAFVQLATMMREALETLHRAHKLKQDKKTCGPGRPPQSLIH